MPKALFIKIRTTHKCNCYFMIAIWKILTSYCKFLMEYKVRDILGIHTIFLSKDIHKIKQLESSFSWISGNLQISHAKTLGIRYTRCLYNNLIHRYSYKCMKIAFHEFLKIDKLGKTGESTKIFFLAYL